MESNEGIAAKRLRLGFVKEVRASFSFLAAYGFTEVEVLPTLVRYKRGGLDLSVHHGRRSYELGVSIGHGCEQFSMGALMRATGGDHFDATATDSDAVALGVAELAALVSSHCERALRDDPESFAKLRSQRKEAADAYSLDVIEEQTIPLAQSAFREGRYCDAVTLYEKFVERLTPAEWAKLAAARKRC